jgi:hypothetical protein
MAENEPIIQPIRTEYDGRPVEDAARDIKKLGDENKKAGDQAEAAAQDTKALGDEQQKAGRKAEDAARDTKTLGDAVDRTGDQARATARETRTLGDETATAGRRTGEAGETIEKTRGRLGGLGDSVKGMVGSWLSFTLIVSTIVAGFRDITSAARDALNAVVELGKNIRGLSANVGGKLADEVVTDINKISLASGFDVAGRNQLIEAIAAQTDVDPSLGRAQLRQSAARLAQLQRATGVGGEAGFDVVQSLQATFGLTQQQAVDQAAVLLNSGLEAQSIQDLAEKAGPVGGQELLARLLAARGEVNLGRAGRALPTIISALTRREADGSLAKSLAGVGISEDQTLVQRIDLLAEGTQSGRINQAQFEQAIGGAENLRLFAPLARARAGQAEAERALATGTAVQEIQKLRQSENVRIAERQQQRELRIKLAEEMGAASPATEGVEDFNTGVQEYGYGSWFLGIARTIGNPAVGAGELGAVVGQSVQSQSLLDEPGGGRGQGGHTTIINHNNYGTTIHQGKDPYTSDLGRPRE